MSLPYSDPANPALPSPLFSDLSAARGDHLRANNNAIFNDLTYLDDLIAALDDAIPPVGTIIARLSGYFGNGSNGGFVAVTSPVSWKWQKCDGRSFYDVRSPWFNQIGRYLPLLTDDRFIMGSNTPGQIGGANSFKITTANLPPHSHSISHDHGSHNHNGETGAGGGHSHAFTAHLTWYHTSVAGWTLTEAGPNWANPGSAGGTWAQYVATDYVSFGGAHAHSVPSATVSFNGNSGDGGFANSQVENRPSYLAVEYYMRVA